MSEKTLALNPNPPVPVLAITALALAALASGVSMRLADALLPRLAREFEVSLGQASQVVTVFAVAYGLAQLLFGPLGDRFGKYRVIGWSCAASALTALLCALAHSHDALMAARLLAGASSSAVIPLAMAWIGDVVAYERRQPVLARFLIGQITGFAIGVWAGGYAAEHLDWRTPFYGVAVLFALAAVLLQWVRRGLPASVVAPRAAAPGNLLQRTLGEFGAVLVRPWARVVLVTVFFEGACLYGPFAFIAAHLHQRFDLPLSTVGALVMLCAGRKTADRSPGRGGAGAHRVGLHGRRAGSAGLCPDLVVGHASLRSAGPGFLHDAQHLADPRHPDGTRAPRRRGSDLCRELVSRPIAGRGRCRAAGRGGRHRLGAERGRRRDAAGGVELQPPAQHAARVGR